MKRRILLAVLSTVVVLFVVGGVFVLAVSSDKAEVPTPVVKSASSLVLSESKALPDKEYYERKNAPSSKKITFEGEAVDVVYERSIIDDCGNVIDFYSSGRLNQFSLNKDGDVVGFWRYYSVEESIKLEDAKYAKSVTEISTVDDAISEAEMYLDEVAGIDLDKCELLFAREMVGQNVYYVAYTTKVGDFITEDVYYVDVALTGEIFSYDHVASPVPEEEAVLGYTYEDVEQRAIKDISETLGSEYKGCTVKNIYAVSLEDGDYFKVVLDVYHPFADGSATTASSDELYYKIK